MAAAGALGAAGCTSTRTAAAAQARALAAPPDPTATQPYQPRTDALVMQVLAHPDDDLFFMNPDTLHSLQEAVPVVSVYVTAGESTGVNKLPFGPRKRHRHDPAAYSSSRHQGLRQAYAAMLGLPHFAKWQTEVIDLGGGLHAEIDSLRNRRGYARLVFLQVSMHEMSASASLPMLWQQPGTVLPYVVAQGAPSPANAPGLYTHQKLVDVLAALMDRFRPTTIRTLDPDPDIQVYAPGHSSNSEQPGYSDHRDHTATALFTWKAMAQWVATATRRDGEVPSFSTASYRGYYNHHWPYNLPPATVALKARFLLQYGGSPTWPCGNAAGCGDYAQGENEPLGNPKGWIRSTHPRYPGASRVIVPAPGGGPRTAYQVLGNRAVRQLETAAGSDAWGPVKDLGGGTLAPALSCVRASDGATLLFALRFAALKGHGGPNARDIVLWRDGVWSSLGNPEADEDRGRRVGAPVAVATADGSVHLFARNAAKGISTRVLRPGGAWSPWQNLGGAEVQEGLSTIVDHAGRVHVFGASHTTVRHWAQTVPGGPVTFRPPTPLPRPAGTPVPTLSPDGTITLTYPRPASTITLRETVRS